MARKIPRGEIVIRNIRFARRIPGSAGFHIVCNENSKKIRKIIVPGKPKSLPCVSLSVSYSEEHAEGENFDARAALYDNGRGCPQTENPMKTFVKVSILAGLILPCIFSARSSRAGRPAQPQPNTGNAATDSSGNDAYYYLTIGHLQEQQFEIDSSAAAASQAIDSYKKALALAPDSPVIMERLAEMYAKVQRIPRRNGRSAGSAQARSRTMWTRTVCSRKFTSARLAI